MALQYFCKNQRRAAVIRDNPAITLNGIDYLEVLDSESPDPSLRQFTLLVRLLRPVPATLTAANVRITGGVRRTPIGVEWAVAAGSAPALDLLVTNNQISPAERDFFLNLFEPERVLVVRTDSRGDYSEYTLHLVASPTANAPPDGFDAILSQVGFSFKVECPTPFDCRPEDDCPPDPAFSPAIDYLAKDYNSFRQLLLDRLAITNPEWQERHIPDLNIALVELLAYTGDYLSYWQDSAATEAYLDMARLRPSLRRHARLLAYAMHDGCNARTWVHFTVDAAADGVTLNVELTASDPQVRVLTAPPVRLLTRLPLGNARVLPSDLDDIESKYRPMIFELRTPVTLRQAHNAIAFHTWGDEECCLPTGATSATLIDTGLTLEVGDMLIFEEVIGTTNSPADVNPAHRHAVRLTSVERTSDPLLSATVDEIILDDTFLQVTYQENNDPLLEAAVVNIKWADEDALPFPLCVRSAPVESATGTLHSLQSAVARGNVALADHGRTMNREELDKFKGHLRYRPVLDRRDLTFAAPLDNSWPAARMLTQDPRDAVASVELKGDGLTWKPLRDLLDSDRFQPDFVAETESDGRVKLRFGDNIYGRKPTTTTFKRTALDPSTLDNGAIYRTGNGSAGNIGAEALAHIVTNQTGITAVRNPLPAVGGRDPESLEEVRQYAPQAFRRQERAVTTADYAMVAERHPEVQRAAATRRWTGSWHTMFITVDRMNGLPVDTAFEERMCHFIERYRLARHDVEIDGPRFVPLDIRMTVCVKPDYFRSEVLAALLKRFSSHVLPDGSNGFFHPDNFTFGQTVYLSDIIANAMAIAGVRWVDLAPAKDKDHRFQRWGEVAGDEFEQGKITMGRLEIAQLDNDPSQAENGYFEFYMEGGL